MDRSSALFLDVDGTLLDLAPDPTSVVVPEGLVDHLRRVATRLGGALALLSGRPVGELDWLFAPLRLVVSGVHGAELRLEAGGPLERRPPNPSLAMISERLHARLDDWPGVLIEDKSLAVAVHFRAVPERRQELRQSVDELLTGVDATLELLEGKRVLEIRERGIDKGTALARIMTVAPFRGRRPVMVGDDTTDEDAFRAALALRGEIKRVGDADGHWIEEPSFATPAAVRDWLAKLAGATEPVG